VLNPNYKKIKEKYSGKKVLVVGLGLLGGGLGVARFFAELGAHVTVTDKKNKNQLISSINQLKNLPVIFHLGAHRLEDFLSADVIFKGPAVPWSLPEIEAALQKQIPVEMELSFVAAHSPAKIIGVTGTRGKSTTTQMIYELLKNNQFPVYFGGSSPHISSIEYLKRLTEKDWLLMELPSWPLSGFHRKKISPHIAVFTNFYPDHLNYYPTMDDYLFDKKAIYLYQKPTDFLVANKTLEPIISKDHPQSQVNYYQATDFKQKFDHLRGEHNRENAAAAITVAKVLRLNLSQSFRILKSFKNINYRQQIVGQKGKIIFVNDTTSTTPIATIKALEAFGDKNIILILGGNSKNLPGDDLIRSLTSVKKIVLLGGSFTKEILPRLQKKYPEKLTAVYESLEEAIFKAWELAQKLSGETYILFSPGATSFAMFNNEFHRGDEFNKIVQKIIS
jgi:UDP-N-acetylmuramoylalanine--D-glutamate ligase